MFRAESWKTLRLSCQLAHQCYRHPYNIPCQFFPPNFHQYSSYSCLTSVTTVIRFVHVCAELVFHLYRCASLRTMVYRRVHLQHSSAVATAPRSTWTLAFRKSTSYKSVNLFHPPYWTVRLTRQSKSTIRFREDDRRLWPRIFSQTRNSNIYNNWPSSSSRGYHGERRRLTCRQTSLDRGGRNAFRRYEGSRGRSWGQTSQTSEVL